MKARQYTWRILAKECGLWKPVCVFKHGDAFQDSAYAARDAMRKLYPSAEFLATNREDWNRCYNAHAKWDKRLGILRGE